MTTNDTKGHAITAYYTATFHARKALTSAMRLPQSA